MIAIAMIESPGIIYELNNARIIKFIFLENNHEKALEFFFSKFFEVKSNIYIRAQDIDTGLGRLGRIDWPRDIYKGTRTLKKVVTRM